MEFFWLFRCFGLNGESSVPYRLLIAPQPRRSLAVAPLIADQRCYGEAPARPAG